MKNKLAIIFSFFLVAISKNSFSNELKSDSVNKFNQNHYITFGLSNIFFFPINIENKNYLSSKFTYSPELNVGYIYDFSKFFMFGTRLNFNKNNFNLNYNFKPPPSSIFANADIPINQIGYSSHVKYMGYNLNLDLMLFLKIYQKKNFFSLGIGARAYTFFRYYLEYNFNDKYYINNQNRNQLVFEGVLNNDNLSTYNFASNIDISYTKKFKNNMLLKTSVLYSYSLNKRLEGTYQFFEIGDDGKKYWYQKLSFIAFSLELVFPTKLQ
jgi:hypothetical protein